MFTTTLNPNYVRSCQSTLTQLHRQEALDLKEIEQQLEHFDSDKPTFDIAVSIAITDKDELLSALRTFHLKPDAQSILTLKLALERAGLDYAESSVLRFGL